MRELAGIGAERRRRDRERGDDVRSDFLSVVSVARVSMCGVNVRALKKAIRGFRRYVGSGPTRL